MNNFSKASPNGNTLVDGFDHKEKSLDEGTMPQGEKEHKAFKRFFREGRKRLAGKKSK